MSAIDELRQTIARLRGRGGCPWDQEQTHQSLARCLIDECSELLDTIDRLDLPHMREELGDVLIQVDGKDVPNTDGLRLALGDTGERTLTVRRAAEVLQFHLKR